MLKGVGAAAAGRSEAGPAGAGRTDWEATGRAGTGRSGRAGSGVGGAEGRELGHRTGRGVVVRMPNVGRPGGRSRTGGDRDNRGGTDGCRRGESGGWPPGGDRSAGATGVNCTAAVM